MPNLTSNASIYRRGGFTFTGYISTPPLTVVLAGTITAVPTYPALSIAYTLTDGDEDDALPDLEVNFYSAAGVKKATLRVATGATVTNISLPVSEFAQGVYDVQVGDTFQVVKYWTIKDRLVSATSVLNKDSRIAYTDQGSNPPPVCNSGGLYAGFNATVGFPGGSTSFVIDPDSGGSITHAWDMIDGAPGSSVVANPSGVVFPVGSRYVKHTATDASNSKSTIEYVLVQVHDKTTYPPLAVQMDALSSSVDQGWRCTFKLPVGSEGSIDSLPDGSLIVYWEDERYNGAQASYGSQMTGRSHIKFVGYLISDSIHIDPENNEVTFEAVSPLAILEQTPSLPQLMVSKSSPTKWSEVKSLTTKKMFVYLAFWHSSLMDTFDFVWNDGVDLSYQRISVEGDTLAAQLRDIANSLGVQVTCDRLGRILFTRDPAYLSLTDRSSRTKTYDLTTADIMEVDITRNHRGTVKSVRGEGITPAGKSFFANGPGNAPAPFGTTTDTLAKQIMSTLASLLERTELYFAKVNSLFKGLFVPKGGRINLPDGYDFFDPAYREFITLALPATLNGRAISWDSSTKWTVESVNISYDIETGSKSIDITIDHETFGVGATQYIPPPEIGNGVTAYPPLEVQYPNLPVDPYIDINGNPTIPPGTTSGNYCEAWSDSAAWLIENILLLLTPPFGENAPDSGLLGITFQWINLGSPGAYLLVNNGTDSTFYFIADINDLSAGWTATVISGVVYTAIRAGATLGEVVIYNNDNSSVSINVPGTTDEPGINTGLYVTSGQTVSVSASGLWGYNADGAIYGPDGNAIEDSSGALLPSADVMSLLGRIGTSGSWNDLGASGSFVAAADGYLYLIGNDASGGFFDNSGNVVAVVTAGGGTNSQTQYSIDYGETFGTVRTVGTSPGGYGGFDTQKLGNIVLAGANGQVREAIAGAAYADYGDPVPTLAQPSAIYIPAKQFGSSSANSGANPHYLLGSFLLTAGDESLWKVTSSGTVFTDITPSIGGVFGVACSPDCIAVAWWNSSYMAVIFDFEGARHLLTTKNGGTTWTDRGEVNPLARYVRFRRGDKTSQQLYIANNSDGILISQNMGAIRTALAAPDGATILGIEPLA